MCSKTGLLRVDPYHPETEPDVSEDHDPALRRQDLPASLGIEVPLDSREIDQIRTWIACGALDGDAGCHRPKEDRMPTSADAPCHRGG